MDPDVYRDLGKQSEAIKSMASDISEIKGILKGHAEELSAHAQRQSRNLGYIAGFAGGISLVVTLVTMGIGSAAEAFAGLFK